jgi:hypothetical protein
MPKTKQFKDLMKSVKKTYLGKPVKKEYKSKYGSIYDLDEIESIAYGIARSKGIKTDLGGKK